MIGGTLPGRASVLLAALLFLSVPAPSPAAQESAAPAGPAFALEEIWRIDRGDDPPYSLYDPGFNSIPPTLLGVLLDDDDGLYLSDAITEQLLRIRPDGSVAFAVGSVGEGPEDHLDQGEPVRWPGCSVGRSDYSIQPKVICYDAQGAFQRSVRLTGFDQYLRVWGLPDRGIGVAMKMLGSPASGSRIRVYLTALAPDGALRDSLLIHEASFPPMGTGYQPTEADFELIPRVAIAEDGLLYVQRDMYRWEIECLDADLHPLWSLRRDVQPVPRTREELDALSSRPGPPPSPLPHVIRPLVPPAGGELWIETLPTTRTADGAVLLDRIGPAGSLLPRVTLAGLPPADGDYEIFGDRLLWKLDDDAPAEPDTPYLAVFRIVAVDAGG